MMLKAPNYEITSMAQRPGFQKGTPWENVGKAIPKGASVDTILQVAGLDWKVLKRPAFVDMAPEGSTDEQLSQIPGSYALLRDDNMEPISPFVGARFKPVQNDAAFRVFEAFSHVGGLSIDTAGSIRGGQIVWGLASINEEYELASGELIKGYFLLVQSHKYGVAMRALFTPIRFPGGHTLIQAGRSETKLSYSMTHASTFNDQRIEKIKETLGVAHKTMINFVRDARTMATTYPSEKQAVEYFVKVFHPDLWTRYSNGEAELPKRVRDLANFEDSNRALKKVPTWSEEYPGASLSSCEGAGTVWGMFQTVSYAFDHAGGRNENARLHSSWLGNNAKKKLKALAAAKSLTR